MNFDDTDDRVQNIVKEIEKGFSQISCHEHETETSQSSYSEDGEKTTFDYDFKISYQETGLDTIKLLDFNDGEIVHFVFYTQYWSRLFSDR